MSGASTGAPERFATPLTSAVLLSIATRTSAPMRTSSLTYEKRALKIDSSTTLVPGVGAQERQHLRLQVGGEARVRRGDDVGPALHGVGLHADPIVAGRHLHPALAQRELQREHVVGARLLDRHVAARDRRPRSAASPSTMRSGMISYSTPRNSLTPLTAIVSPPWPLTCAPIATRKFAEVDDLRLHRRVADDGRRRPPSRRRASRSWSRRRWACGRRSRRRAAGRCSSSRSDSRVRPRRRRRARGTRLRACRWRACRGCSRRAAGLRRGRSGPAAVRTGRTRRRACAPAGTARDTCSRWPRRS